MSKKSRVDRSPCREGADSAGRDKERRRFSCVSTAALRRRFAIAARMKRNRGQRSARGGRAQLPPKPKKTVKSGNWNERWGESYWRSKS